MQKIILLIMLIIMNSANASDLKRKIASKMTFKEGQYELEKNSDSRCSEGLVVWIYDESRVALQIGAKIIIPDIGTGRHAEDMGSDCMTSYVTDYSDDKIIYESRDTCKKDIFFTKIEVLFENEAITYNTYKKSKDKESFALTFSCRLKIKSHPPKRE